MGDDPLGRAIRDQYHGEQDEPLIDRDGTKTREQPIEQFYLGEFDSDGWRGEWLTSLLDGPLLDIGAGAGWDALYFQNYKDERETLLFRLFSPDRLREATVGTGWTVTEVRHGPSENTSQYSAALKKI